MLLSWSFPRAYASMPVSRVRAYVTFTPAQSRPQARPAQAKPAATRHAGIDRADARALVDAGYMSLSRYVELFGDNVGEGEV